MTRTLVLLAAALAAVAWLVHQPAFARPAVLAGDDDERARARRDLRMPRMMSRTRNGTVIAMSAPACLCGVSRAKAGW